ncbi:MAG: bifunctional diaminohydroxyphosphoribosylaminopyrimidine deaminase/5-amino-6-(5-phosphoribosylamino)uracil reductase RibD [Chitinophagaceae bacterium]
MQRCLELASRGAGKVAPNPMVGAVLLYDDRIIGEGYHESYGQAHAEVNCIQSVHPLDQALIEKSTLYVSLEPCAHHGKTPPCTELIIRYKIPRVVIACNDPYQEVNGKGIELLKAAGVEVTVGVLESAAKILNQRFICCQEKKRPYIILKWAQSADGKIAANGNHRTYISNEYTNILVHRWRSEEAAILVGAGTAIMDNPALTVRAWKGNNPLRLLIDRNLKTPASAQLLDQSVPTIVFNSIKESTSTNLRYCLIKETADFIPAMLEILMKEKIQSILVEGGAELLNAFIQKGLWEEARIITNTALEIGQGLAAPILKDAFLKEAFHLHTDHIQFYQPSA